MCCKWIINIFRSRDDKYLWGSSDLNRITAIHFALFDNFLHIYFLMLYQPYAIFFKINNWIYIKFKSLYWFAFLPNVGYFFFAYVKS